MNLTPDDWARITATFNELQPLAASERERRLSVLASADAAIAVEVASLLDADADDGFLEGAPAGRLLAEPLPASRLIGQVIGTYRIEREVGRGGMGVVYEGRHLDRSLDKRVAVKTLAIGLDRPELVWRFRREQRILARLEHPNIAALYDGGTTADGLPYLVMEYVDGVRVDRWCDEQRLTIAQRLDLFRQVCAAVGFAHAKLIVHRDLKPNNIMVTADGVVKLLDFGIATLSESTDPRSGELTERTNAGMSPRTAAFASPEQMRGEEVTTASDVYSLGVILYRLLTGSSPYANDAAASVAVRDSAETSSVRTPSEAVTANHAAQCQVDTARSLRDTLRGELDAIVLMALRAEPSRRYASAAALSADLLRFLKGLPVEARPDTLGYRVTKFVRRQRALVVAIAVAVLALVGGTVASLVSARTAIAEANRTRALVSVLQGIVGASGSDSSRTAPTLFSVLDSARRSLAVKFADDTKGRAAAYEYFGASYLNLERPDLALLMFDSARVLHSASVGPKSIEVARDLAASFNPLIALGQTDSAMARLRRVIDDMRAIRPLPERDLAGAEIELGFNEIVLLSRVDSALPRLARAVDVERRQPSPHWDRIAMAEAVTIMPYYYRKEPERADSAYARSARALQRDSSTSHSHRSALAFAGQSLLLRGRPAEAEPFIRELLRATALRLGTAHYLTAQAQNLLAKVMMELARYNEGRALVDSAIANNVAAPVRDPLYLGEMYLTRANFEIKQRSWAAAQRSIKEATTQQQRLGVQRPILEVSIRYTTAGLFEAQGKIEAARDGFTRAAEVAHASLQPGARNVGLAEEKLAAFVARHPVRNGGTRTR